ncbi:hypothetical protein AVEN_37908-1 [Araneus ventricosus]|uniref:Uncharacterized protein n=1 Tax=Araneus ventricosus TaxID=182803 RepID=A0A4Y2UGP8_ARAVE|nr:hypothetical protein AVEN_37908-1 [Araneus ventricosus]
MSSSGVIWTWQSSKDKSEIEYFVTDMTRNQYPRRRNGSEYYSRGRKPFVVDPGGKERYAQDKIGNEIYPKRKLKQFARDKYFQEYYARDSKNNEFYPIKKRYSVVIQTKDGYKLAKWADGLQRYPTDVKGNEYYLTQNGEPILIYQEDGKPYFAKNKRGISQIPWNALQEYVSEAESHVEAKDALGNQVFLNRNEIPKSSANSVCRCLCEIMTICPSVGYLFANTLLR